MLIQRESCRFPKRSVSRYDFFVTTDRPKCTGLETQDCTFIRKFGYQNKPVEDEKQQGSIQGIDVAYIGQPFCN